MCGCTSVRTVTPLVRVPVQVAAGIVFVPVTIDGQGPFAFELDSGFQNCAIERTVAKTLGLEVGPLQRIPAPGGTVERATVNNAHLAVGGRGIDKPAISALDLQQFGPFFGRSPDGVLGYDLFRQYVVTVDYQRKTLALFDPASFRAPAKAVVVPIDTTLRQPYVEATLLSRDGRSHTGRFEIDTGSVDALNLNTPVCHCGTHRSNWTGDAGGAWSKHRR